MSKRFIIAIDNVAHPQRLLREDKFIDYARSKGMSWWNRIPSLWLLVDDTGKMTATQLDDDVHDIFDASCVVFELRGDDSDTWAGHGPRGMFKWLKSLWGITPAAPEADGERRQAGGV